MLLRLLFCIRKEITPPRPPPLFPSSFYAGHNSVLTRGRKRVVVGFGLGQCISRCVSLFPPSRGGGDGSTVVISFVLFVCRLWAPSSFHFFYFIVHFLSAMTTTGRRGRKEGQSWKNLPYFFLFLCLDEFSEKCLDPPSLSPPVALH